MQHHAIAELKVLGYLAELAMEQGCILSKQCEQITKRIHDCQNLAADDLVLLHESCDYLNECLARMRELTWNELHLEFNEKTQVFPVSRGVDYLGWHFYPSDTGKAVKRLRTSSKRRLKRRLRKLQEQHAAGEIDAETALRVIAGLKGHLSQGDTCYLRERLFGDVVLRRTAGFEDPSNLLP